MVRDLYDMRLAQAGELRRTVARDGVQGLEFSRAFRFQPIVPGLMLPVSDGCEVTRELRGRGDKTPILTSPRIT